MPSESRDDDRQHHASIQEVVTDGGDIRDTQRGSQDLVDRPESSQSSARSITPAETQKPPPLPVEESSQPPTRNRRPMIPESTSVPVGVPTEYVLSQPFDEAGPMSSIWQVYLDESEIRDREICKAHRGETNILLIFAGLFSAVVSTFIAQSLTNLQPNYQQLSALLVFDQINIQRAIANGTSLDTINTSGVDPTVAFTPKRLDSWVNGLWLASLTLSLSYAFLAVLADEWHSHYLSSIDENPQVRSRTRQLRYTGLIEWRVSTLISVLPLMLHLSLGLFFVGLILSLSALEQGIALMIGIISFATFIVYFVTNFLPLIYPQCPYKTTISYVLFPIVRWILRQIPPSPRENPWLLSRFLATGIKTLQRFEIDDAEVSHVRHDLDALFWLYVRSSTSAMRRLVIHALSGLPLEYLDKAKEIFKLHWDEIRSEKESMLMDCMELTQDGATRWISKDIPNIDRRIEPLLRLGRLFPQLRQRDSSGIFGAHKLKFSMKSFSDSLLTTLSTYDDPSYIQMDWGLYPIEEFTIAAFNDNRLHHPAVWRDLYNNMFYYGHDDRKSSWNDLNSGEFFGPGFKSKTYLRFLEAIYPSERNPSISPACTLVNAAVQVDKRNIITVLLSLLTEYPLNESESSERALLFAIMHFSLSDTDSVSDTDSAQSTVDSHQHPFPLDDNFKLQLLCIAVPALNRIVHPLKSLPEFDAEVFQEIGAYIASDLFSREPPNSVIHALECLASLMHREPRFHVLVRPEIWATKSLFWNIARIHNYSKGDPSVRWRISQPEFRPCHQGHIKLHSPDDSSNVNCLIIYILSQCFSRGVKEASEAFGGQFIWDYIAEHAYKHPEAIDGVTSYFTGLSNATKKQGNENPIVTLPSSYIDDLHQAETIRSICAAIVCSGAPPRPILDSLASIAPDHQQWSDILKKLSPSGEFLTEIYNYRWRPSDDEVKRLNEEMKHAVEILEKRLDAKRHPMRHINWTRLSSKPQPRDLEKSASSGPE